MKELEEDQIFQTAEAKIYKKLTRHVQDVTAEMRGVRKKRLAKHHVTIEHRKNHHRLLEKMGHHDKNRTSC